MKEKLLVSRKDSINMPLNLRAQAKVSLYGVSQNALHLGRACALQDNPVLGIYDPDPETSLRAALFLGVSARSDLTSLLKEEPDILICSLALPSCGFTGLVIDLNTPPGGWAQVCSAIAPQTGESHIPAQITSELPAMQFTLSGPHDLVEAGRAFLSSLSAQITLETQAL